MRRRLKHHQILKLLKLMEILFLGRKTFILKEYLHPLLKIKNLIEIGINIICNIVMSLILTLRIGAEMIRTLNR